MIDWNTKFGRLVRKLLKSEYFIWLTTVDSNLTPQPRPVWFIWDDDSFLIFSKPNVYKVKHIAIHPNVALHFNTDESGDNHVIIFTGEASIDMDCPPAHKVPAYLKKYKMGITDLNMTPKGFSNEYSTAIRIWPTDLRGWE